MLAPTVWAMSSTPTPTLPIHPALAPAGRTAQASRAHGVQATFDDLGTPLAQVTFVVVDLETTGGSSIECAITEIGAVKVRGGEVLGQFQTLVNPGEPIPAVISVLTGITDSMVAGAPRIATVLPSFLEFVGNSVLVAHNAPFDVGFLRAAADRLGIDWPGYQVLDTVKLARQLVGRDEAPNHKLASLARLFGATQTPDHRALHDARATVDVLHALIGRVGNLGVHTLEELLAYSGRVSEAQRRKRHLARDLPSAPGVYQFRDERGRVLYVGTSVDIRRRVSTYFTASEQRSRMAEMVNLAESVTPIVCATPLEAAVRELRLIAQHEPPYNRRSRRPHRRPWVKVTIEAFPRLSIVRDLRPDGACYAGPFASVHDAQAAIDGVHDVLPLRQCSKRLSRTRASPACMLADLDRCLAPCTLGAATAGYGSVVEQLREALRGSSREVLGLLGHRMRQLSQDERYEEAALARDRLRSLSRAIDRAQRVAALTGVAHLVAARRHPLGGWEIVCARHGRMAGATRTPRGADPMPYIAACTATAEVVEAPAVPAATTLIEETELLLRWLDTDGVRLVEVDGAWTCPLGASAALLEPRRTTRHPVDW
ncbi:DNA polymerase III subunit epsilon [Kineosphaera limosa NBRC 100340]|uniref:DNA polymerase III subunit epsilon n=2 Tax=Kineosphaera TaxID=211469 RepID=K6WCD8_9MICO|nr:DNA polymerase III subunit epsilon [Kineosphaera limosa NBRC 100340]